MVRAFFLILIFTLLVLTFNSFYNQEKRALAYEYETRCETLIPTGHAIDETQRIAQEIIDNLEIILQESEEQIDQAENMINFANQCHRDRCSTGCREWTETHSECVARRMDGSCRRWRTWTTYHCAVLPCSDDACDFSGIDRALQQIQESYNKVSQSQKNIKNIIEETFKPDSHIDKLLFASKAGLEYCAGFVRITEEMTPEEIERLIERREIKKLLHCDFAKTAVPGLKCHPNDFFCCG